jgi:predicted type IV restriction endonuclease
MPRERPSENEWLTRKRRIDPKLDATGWLVAKRGATAYRTEEEETNNGPADYVRRDGAIPARHRALLPARAALRAVGHP